MYQKEKFLDKHKTFKYSVGEGVFIKQRPQRLGKVSAFSNIALSDKYMAVGSDGRVQVFLIEGQYAGRWVYSDDIDGAVINKLCFSADGRQLIALMVYADSNIEEARIYPVERFPSGDLERTEVAGQNLLKPISIKWERNFMHNPQGIVFSSKGNMVAICTSRSEGEAQIRILKREAATWRMWGVQGIPDSTSLHSRIGFTGITL